jgi:hypothetical protein
MVFSAEIEVTVSFLIEIDKLVQLLESPIFICSSFSIWPGLTRSSSLTKDLSFHLRLETPVVGAREVSLFIQELIWIAHVVTAK